MKKRTFLLALVLTALVFVGYAVAAGGDASDPLVSLDFLNGTFRRQAEERIDEAVTKADAGALDDAKARWNAAVAAAEAAVGSDYAAVFTETRVKQDDILSGVTGLQVIPLAGELTVSFSAGTVVDVTDGRELTSGSTIPINHRCLVAEDTTALFTCTSKTAVLSYCGSYHFALSDKPDRNAMAEALQSLSLFRGTGSGIGSGYELEKTPTRAEALIMLIRMLGEEKAQHSPVRPSQPFIDVPDWCAPYVAYAYERGYSNGVGTDSLGHSYFGTRQTASAAMYVEFMLRALGYSSTATTNISDALDRAVTAGVLTAGERTALQSSDFLRADVAYLSYYALSARTSGGAALSRKLIDAGVFTDADYRAAQAMVTTAPALPDTLLHEAHTMD